MILELIILAVSVIVLFNWWAHGYWKRRNVFSLPTDFIFGNMKEIIMGQKLISIMFYDIYKKYKNHRMIGFYCFHKPMLFVTDPEIIKQILVTDFNSFSNNGFTLDKKRDPLLGNNPFTAKSIPVWKELRSIQAANQTTLKLKEVVPNLVKIEEHMSNFIKTNNNQPISPSDLTTRLAIDSAVLSGFGIEPKSFTDPEFSFIKHASGDKVFTTSSYNMIATLFIPLLNSFFDFRITSKETEDFFLSMTKTTLDHRQSAKTTRGDLFDTILKFNKKKMEQNKKGYPLSELSSHCATFYLDSTVTAAMALTFAMLELANHQDVQEKLRKEILSVGKKPEDFDYDKINSITYLQMVFDETVRRHAPLSFISRICTKDIVIDDVKISKGTKVFISPMGLQSDPEYFPDPEKFDPERFSDVNKGSIVKYTFLPFGEGPRICVGMKYGTLFVKTSIAFLLLKFRLLPTTNPGESIEMYDNFLLLPKEGATVKIEEL